MPDEFDIKVLFETRLNASWDSVEVAGELVSSDFVLLRLILIKID